MNQGTAASVSATKNSITNNAMNSGLACRAKCHRNPISPAGGSGCSGVAVGFRNRSKRANIYCEYRKSRDVSTVACRAGAGGDNVAETIASEARYDGVSGVLPLPRGCCLGNARPRAGHLPGAADPDFRRLSGRRAAGHRRAPAGGAVLRELGQIGGGGERDRWRRQYRGRARGQVGARRLHAVDGEQRDRHQSKPLSIVAVTTRCATSCRYRSR